MSYRGTPIKLAGSIPVGVAGPSDCSAAPAHHWVLSTPSGGTFSEGRCKHCHLVRDDFRNAADDSLDGVFGQDNHRLRAGRVAS